MIPCGFSLSTLKEELRRSAKRWNQLDAYDFKFKETIDREDTGITSDVVLYMEPI
jgi:hypothetical protein